jgi:hypothetical protein
LRGGLGQAVAPRGVRGARHQGFVPGVADGAENPLVVGRDDGARDASGRQRALDDVQDHRTPADLQKWFSGQTARRVTRGDDGNDSRGRVR